MRSILVNVLGFTLEIIMLAMLIWLIETALDYLFAYIWRRLFGKVVPPPTFRGLLPGSSS